MTNLLSNTPIARKSDGVTSHAAANEVTRSGQRARQQHAVLTLVRRYPNHTSNELSRYGVDRYAIARRLPELEAAGLIERGHPRRCEVSGKLATTWAATVKGERA